MGLLRSIKVSANKWILLNRIVCATPQYLKPL